MEAALRFDDLHRRLKLLAGLKNRAPILHLLHALSDTGTAAAAARRHAGAAGIPQIPPRVFSEPSAGLTGIEHVGGQALGAAPTASAAAGHGRAAPNGRALGGGDRLEGRHGEAVVGERVGRHRPEGNGRAIARRTTEVTERTLLKGILYAFQVRRFVVACGGFGSAGRVMLCCVSVVWVRRPGRDTSWAGRDRLLPGCACDLRKASLLLMMRSQLYLQVLYMYRFLFVDVGHLKAVAYPHLTLASSAYRCLWF